MLDFFFDCFSRHVETFPAFREDMLCRRSIYSDYVCRLVLVNSDDSCVTSYREISLTTENT